jgi:ABC-2 type transport system permease protein
MIRIFDIAIKDWVQLVRDRKVFLFSLIMPIAFTLMFGFAFGGFGGGASDARLPVALLDQDASRMSKQLRELFIASTVIRVQDISSDVADVEKLVADNKYAGAVVIPSGYGHAILENKPVRLTLFVDTSTNPGMTIQAEIVSLANRLNSSAQTATIMEETIGDRAPFEYSFKKALDDWKDPPIAVTETTSSLIAQNKTNSKSASLAHYSPGMMLQFAIASLLTAAQVLVSERKSRALQRLLTTATNRIHILLGHYLAIFGVLLLQFIILIAFGSFVLKVDYLREPVAILVVATSAALCIAAMGLFIGVIAKSEDQVVVLSLLPMFLLSGFGGAWVPLEVTGEVFQAIGHFSPVAWAMDGFKNISIRGLGFESVLIPASALLVYALVFFVLASWRMQVAEERG